MDVLFYTSIFSADPSITLEMMEENGVTCCYFNQTVLCHERRELVFFPYLFICLQGSCWVSLNGPKTVRQALKYKEAESSNISHSGRSISSRKAEMEVGLAVFSRKFQQQSPTGSSLRDGIPTGCTHFSPVSSGIFISCRTRTSDHYAQGFTHQP